MNFALSRNFSFLFSSFLSFFIFPSSCCSRGESEHKRGGISHKNLARWRGIDEEERNGARCGEVGAGASSGDAIQEDTNGR
jgi:hypothetical protein